MLQHVRVRRNQITSQGMDERNIWTMHIQVYHSFLEISMKGMNYYGTKEPKRVWLRDQAEGQQVTSVGGQGDHL